MNMLNDIRNCCFNWLIRWSHPIKFGIGNWNWRSLFFQIRISYLMYVWNRFYTIGCFLWVLAAQNTNNLRVPDAYPWSILFLSLDKNNINTPDTFRACLRKHNSTLVSGRICKQSPDDLDLGGKNSVPCKLRIQSRIATNKYTVSR